MCVAVPSAANDDDPMDAGFAWGGEVFEGGFGDVLWSPLSRTQAALSSDLTCLTPAQTIRDLRDPCSGQRDIIATQRRLEEKGRPVLDASRRLSSVF